MDVLLMSRLRGSQWNDDFLKMLRLKKKSGAKQTLSKESMGKVHWMELLSCVGWARFHTHRVASKQYAGCTKPNWSSTENGFGQNGGTKDQETSQIVRECKIH